MRRNTIYSLPILYFSSLILCSENQKRQTTSSSISVPTYRYGYYSDVYPTGAVTTMPTTTVASPITVNGTSMAESEVQTGQYGPVGVSQAEAFIASMCQPINKTNQPDLNFPCNKIILDEAPCVYGKNYEELLKTYVNDSPATPMRSSKDQFECFCADSRPGQSYWQNSVHCSECRRLHGASAQNVDNFAPARYIQEFSSAYCAQPSSNAVALQDYVTMWSATPTVDLGTSTGGSNVLGSSTDVSLYTTTNSAMTSSTSAISSAISPSGTTAGQAGVTEGAQSAGSSRGAEGVGSATIFSVGLLAAMCF